MLAQRALFTILNHYNPSAFPRQLACEDTQRRAVFVSVYLNDSLIGCVGEPFSQENTCKSVERIAINAMKDERFSQERAIAAIQQRKGSSVLRVEVNVLEPFRQMQHVFDYDLENEGVHILLVNGMQEEKSAIYLPHVATEQHWDKHRMIASLMMKAGVRLKDLAFKDSQAGDDKKKFSIERIQKFRTNTERAELRI